MSAFLRLGRMARPLAKPFSSASGIVTLTRQSAVITNVLRSGMCTISSSSPAEEAVVVPVVDTGVPSSATLEPSPVVNKQPKRKHVDKSGETSQSDMQNRIWKAGVKRNAEGVIICAMEAGAQSMDLDMKDYMTILWACVELPSHDKRTEVAFWVYEKVNKLEDEKVPIECFLRLLRVCAHRGDSKIALKVVADYENLGYPITERVLTDTLLALARDKRTGMQFDSYFNIFQNLADKNGWNGSRALYSEVAKAYGRFRKNDEVLKVLQIMTDKGYEPSLPLCNYLLEVALFSGWTNVLRVLAKWYLQNFSHKLEYGSLCRMLQVSLEELLILLYTTDFLFHAE